MKINETDLITVPRSRKPGHYQFIGASDARIINSLDEAALIRLWTGDPSPARAAKSLTARAQFLRPIRGKSSRASREQRQAAAKSMILTTGIRGFMKACAILSQKLYARFSENTFDQGDPVRVSRVATDLDICDRVSMKTGRPSQVPNRQIERSTRHPNLCACQQARNAKQSNEGGSK